MSLPVSGNASRSEKNLVGALGGNRTEFSMNKKTETESKRLFSILSARPDFVSLIYAYQTLPLARFAAFSMPY